jgi:hypothetical protein
MSLRAVARQHGNRGAGRTRFPSVNALSEFSHNQGHKRASDQVELRPKFSPLYLRKLPGIAALPSKLKVCQVQTSGLAGEWLSLEARHTRLTLAGTENSPNASEQHRVDAIAACHRILGRRSDVGKFIAE